MNQNRFMSDEMKNLIEGGTFLDYDLYEDALNFLGNLLALEQYGDCSRGAVRRFYAKHLCENDDLRHASPIVLWSRRLFLFFVAEEVAGPEQWMKPDSEIAHLIINEREDSIWHAVKGDTNSYFYKELKKKKNEIYQELAKSMEEHYEKA